MNEREARRRRPVAREVDGENPGPDLSVDLGGLQLCNPVLIASGVFGYGEGYPALDQLKRLGGVVLKSTTLEPRLGNPGSARTVETPAGMINSIGLENPGLDVVIREKLPFIRKFASSVVVSVAGCTESDFVEMARRLDQVEGVSAIELNISCPNVEQHGMAFGVDPVVSERIVRGVRGVTRLPIIPKLTPNVTDITVIARACENGGAHALALVNTISAMSIDIRSRRPRLAANFGGLSGPAVRPAAILRVYQVSQAVRLPIIGMGGIWDADDAIEFLVAGASAVEVGTSLFYDPRRPWAIVDGLGQFLEKERIGSVSALVGTVQLNTPPPSPETVEAPAPAGEERVADSPS